MFWTFFNSFFTARKVFSYLKSVKKPKNLGQKKLVYQYFYTWGHVFHSLPVCQGEWILFHNQFSNSCVLIYRCKYNLIVRNYLKNEFARKDILWDLEMIRLVLLQHLNSLHVPHSSYESQNEWNQSNTSQRDTWPSSDQTRCHHKINSKTDIMW